MGGCCYSIEELHTELTFNEIYKTRHITIDLFFDACRLKSKQEAKKLKNSVLLFCMYQAADFTPIHTNRTD